MDFRIKLGEIFGLELSDVEFIRNAGGRVTLDVLRSLTVACEIKKKAQTSSSFITQVRLPDPHVIASFAPTACTRAHGVVRSKASLQHTIECESS
jgi:hypothetical protein